MRLDKFISTQTPYTRAQIKRLVKAGAVTVDKKTVSSCDTKIDPEKNVVCVEGKEITYQKHVYFLLQHRKLSNHQAPWHYYELNSIVPYLQGYEDI